MDWKRVEKLFHASLECPPAERDEFLRTACGDDKGLYTKIKSLLSSHKETDYFMEDTPVEHIASQGKWDETQLIGKQIGPFRIESLLGLGGTGAVYKAQRIDEQYEQNVAIKLIRFGALSRNMLLRFHRERQVLAKLNHPNIAQLLDGGVTEQGEPYLVIELIQGKPLLQYCNEQGLSIHKRLQLFIQVCAAVSHAHQNLILHRDIKSNNIMVTEEGHIKLLDFGTAKILEEEHGSEKTSIMQGMMTPQYASPEQIKGERITTASDIYSLGVVLYELLTGKRPYDVSTGISPYELSKIVCETQPSLPSQIRRELQGDLDAIVLMAMHKESQRRYSSTEKLSTDIERYLTQQPVVARRDTYLYRVTKFYQRNTAACLFGVVAVLSLFAAVGLTSWKAYAEQKQRQIAEANLQRALEAEQIALQERDRAQSAEARAEEEAQKARAETQKAQEEEKKAKTINQFMLDIFGAANPQSGSRDITVRDALAHATETMESKLAAEPVVLADLHHTIGHIYVNVGENKDAIEQLNKAIKMRSELYGEQGLSVGLSLFDLGFAQLHSEEIDQAEATLSKALEILQQHYADNHPQVMKTKTWLAEAKKNRGGYEESILTYKESIDKLRDGVREADEEFANILDQVAPRIIMKIPHDEALEKLLDQFFAIVDQRYANKREVIEPLLNFMKIEFYRGHHPTAARVAYACAKVTGNVFGKQVPIYAQMLYHVANMESYLDHHEKSIKNCREALQICENTLGENHPLKVQLMNMLGDQSIRSGEFDAAEDILQQVRNILQKNEQGSSTAFIDNLHSLAELESAKQNYPQVISYYQQSIKLISDSRGSDSYGVGLVQSRIADAYYQIQDYENAEKMSREALAIFLKSFGEGSEYVTDTREQLVEILNAKGKQNK